MPRRSPQSSCMTSEMLALQSVTSVHKLHFKVTEGVIFSLAARLRCHQPTQTQRLAGHPSDYRLSTSPVRLRSELPMPPSRPYLQSSFEQSHLLLRRPIHCAIGMQRHEGTPTVYRGDTCRCIHGCNGFIRLSHGFWLLIATSMRIPDSYNTIVTTSIYLPDTQTWDEHRVSVNYEHGHTFHSRRT